MLVRRHFDGVVAWSRTRQTNGFIEALNGLFQAAKRKARGYTRLTTMRTVLFLIAGKLDFSMLNPHLKSGRRALSPKPTRQTKRRLACVSKNMRKIGATGVGA